VIEMWRPNTDAWALRGHLDSVAAEAGRGGGSAGRGSWRRREAVSMIVAARRLRKARRTDSTSDRVGV